MALTTDQVVERLLETVGGQIVACNVLAGVQNGLVDAAWATEVLAWMGTVGGHADYADSAGILRALEVLRTRRSTVLPHGAPDIRLRGADAPSPFQVEVSWVQPAWKLRRLVSSEDRERLAREGLVLPTSRAGVLSTATVDEWRNKPALARTVRVEPAATVGGRRHDVVWFTRRAALDEAVVGVSPSVRAQRTRDLLGLVHHQEGAMLVAMHFQPPTLSACPSARPTFADAGMHTRFKAWPDDEAARKDRSWGRTVDLHALDESAASVDGCPERVANTIDGHSLADGATFEFELLGAVQAPAAQGDAARAAFASRLLNGRTVAELETELNALASAHPDH